MWIFLGPFKKGVSVLQGFTGVLVILVQCDWILFLTLPGIHNLQNPVMLRKHLNCFIVQGRGNEEIGLSLSSLRALVHFVNLKPRYVTVVRQSCALVLETLYLLSARKLSEAHLPVRPLLKEHITEGHQHIVRP